MTQQNNRLAFNSLATSVCRGSTIVFDDFKSFEERKQRQPDGFSYGITGSPTHRELENRISEMEQVKHTVVLPSGQAALVLVLMATLKYGDHIIVPDACYGPVRNFITENLASFGVEVTFVPPRDTEFIREVVKNNTRLIMMESPCSLTMEVQDIEAITDLAKEKGILTLIDNSWGGPVLSSPFKYGINFIVEAVSKIMNGHSDILLGSVSTNDIAMHKMLRALQDTMGLYVSPDDCFLALRGLETYALRQEKQSRSAQLIAQWLESHEAIGEVIHPALSSSVDNVLYTKYFKDYGSVFSFTLKNENRMDAFFNALSRFKIGASYGGTVSLIAYYSTETLNSREYYNGKSSLLRVSIGIEDTLLLIEELKAALQETM